MGDSEHRDTTIEKESPTTEKDEAKKLKVDWGKLRAEFTWDKLWTNRSWRDIVVHFAKVLLLTILPTLVDMTTDALNGIDFVVGTDYMKQVVNSSDPLNENCTLVGTYLKHGGDGETWIEYEDLSCHEKDQIWGYVSLGFIFLSGLLLAKGTCQRRMKEAKQDKKSWLALFWISCLVLSMVPCGSLFPLILVGVHLCALLNAGPEMEKLTSWVTRLEGSWESTFQFLLAVFIILSRSDRTPSNLQLVSLAASLISVIKTQIEGYLRKKHATNLPFLDKISKASVLFPMFLTSAIFKLGSIAVTCAMLRYIAIPVLLAAFLLVLGLGWGLGIWLERERDLIESWPNHVYTLYIVRERPSDSDEYLTPKATIENFLYNNIAWFVLYLLILTTIVTMATIQDRIESLKTFWQDPDYARNILVHNLGLLWAIYGVIILCGIISGLLIFFQIWRPYKEEEEIANSQVGFKLLFCSHCPKYDLSCQNPQKNTSH